MANLQASDVLVQRGTIHNRVNNGSEPCIIAFVLIEGKPFEASGDTLNFDFKVHFTPMQTVVLYSMS